MEIFSKWILDELNRRGWPPAELARKARIDTGNLSRILSGTRKVGPDVCNSIAEALGLPPELVFRKAGLLPEFPNERRDTGLMLEMFNRLPDDEKSLILEFTRWRYQKSMENEAKTGSPGED